MRGFLSGAAFGVVLTTLVAYIWPSTPSASASAQAAGPLHTVSADRSQQRTASISEPPREVAQTVPPLVPLAVAPLPTTPVTNGRTGSSLVQPSPIIEPIKLSAEHARVLLPPSDAKRPPTLPELHMQFVSQSKDPNWSFETEQSIRKALTTNENPAEFDILSVDCRRSLCEVLAFGNLPTSGEKWNGLWDGIAKEPWYAEFKGNTTSSFVQNNRYTIVTIIQRPGKK